MLDTVSSLTRPTFISIDVRGSCPQPTSSYPPETPVPGLPSQTPSRVQGIGINFQIADQTRTLM